MTSVKAFQILNVSLNRPFESLCAKSDFLFLRLSSDTSARWRLIDLRISSPQNLHPFDGEICSWIEVSGLDQYLEFHRLPINQTVSSPDCLTLDLHMRELHSEFTGSACDRDMCLRLLFALILLDFQRLADTASRAADLSDERLEQVVHRMLAEYRYPWRVEDLSELLNVSPSYLNRLCRRKYGMSPIDMLIEHRINIAKRYLLLPGAKVGAVCEAVGFSDIYYFSRSFKKRCGVTPTEYMKNPPKANAIPHAAI